MVLRLVGERQAESAKHCQLPAESESAFNKI